jgi:hypothetical protein
MSHAVMHSRTLTYRDNSGEIAHVTIEAEDPKEVDRIARLYQRLEARSLEHDWKYEALHINFSDLEPGTVLKAKKPQAELKRKGYPWEGPRYSFTLYLADQPIWQGAEGGWRRGFRVSANLWEEGILACDLMPRWVWNEKKQEWFEDWRPRRLRWVWDDEGEEVGCRYCAQYLGDLPMIAYCLGCDASGRDLAIPKGIPRRTRNPRPKSKKDDGLEGGMRGKP